MPGIEDQRIDGYTIQTGFPRDKSRAGTDWAGLPTHGMLSGPCLSEDVGGRKTARNVGGRKVGFLPWGYGCGGQGSSPSGFCAPFNAHGFMGMDCAFVQGVVIKIRCRNFNKNDGRV
jgi:hypothetical protein